MEGKLLPSSAADDMLMMTFLLPQWLFMKMYSAAGWSCQPQRISFIKSRFLYGGNQGGCFLFQPFTE